MRIHLSMLLALVLTSSAVLGKTVDPTEEVLRTPAHSQEWNEDRREGHIWLCKSDFESLPRESVLIGDASGSTSYYEGVSVPTFIKMANDVFKADLAGRSISRISLAATGEYDAVLGLPALNVPLTYPLGLLADRKNGEMLPAGENAGIWTLYEDKAGTSLSQGEKIIIKIALGINGYHFRTPCP